MTKDQLEKTVISLMDEVTTMTLATCKAESPWAAAVYYARQGFDLVFFSSPRSRHCEILANNPRAAATIHGAYSKWQDIKGLQMRGETYLVEPGAEWDSAWKHYQDKFLFVRSMKAVVAQNRLYVFIPNWIRLMDNSQGFGYKKEWRQ